MRKGKEVGNGLTASLLVILIGIAVNQTVKTLMRIMHYCIINSPMAHGMMVTLVVAQ